jgi:hypothetical protein
MTFAKGTPAPADFTTLVLSLSTSALMHLGEVPAEDGKPMPKNLALASHTIDLLAMLEEKTRGNLTGDEERILSGVLYDLRLKYTAAT